MGGFGWPELVVILVIVLVLFGAKRLPEIGRSLGSGMREFKDSVKDGEDADDTTTTTDATSPDVITPGDDKKKS